ncbi:MAG: hypothetical protein H0V33_01850 [Acidimicrobiia bacterium]|nr:hypothetical protein [Acidimicrobiia bacterium]
MRVVFLDNEAVHALADPGHRKHRTVLAHLAVVARRRRRGLGQRVVVPTAVRVEAGWDRHDPAAAVINRHTVIDASLDPATADTATRTAPGRRCPSPMLTSRPRRRLPRRQDR